MSIANLDHELECLQKPLIAFLTDFCAIDTSNPPGRNYLACCELLRDKLESMGLKTRIHRVPKAEQAKRVPGYDDYPRYNVVARWDVGAAKTLHLTGHYDVVPATGGWSTDPFSPVIKAGRFYARGADDMKGANACAIFAVQALMQAGLTPPWNIELSFTADEETGGQAGLSWLVDTGKIKPDAAILLEGGNGRSVGCAHRGVLWANVTVQGKAGHASNPRDNGVNALENAILIIQQLQQTAAQYPKRQSRYESGSPLGHHPTMMIGGVCATGPGNKVNTIPDQFSFSIDRRMIPEENLKDVQQEIFDAIKRAQARNRQVKAQVEFPLHAQAGQSPDIDHPIYNVGLQVVSRIRRNRPRLRMSGGFNDMRFLTNDAGVPTMGYGTAGKGAHGDNESVPLDELATVMKIYSHIIMSMPA